MRPNVSQAEDFKRSINYYKLSKEPLKLIFSPETQCFVFKMVISINLLQREIFQSRKHTNAYCDTVSGSWKMTLEKFRVKTTT